MSVLPLGVSGVLLLSGRGDVFLSSWWWASLVLLEVVLAQWNGGRRSPLGGDAVVAIHLLEVVGSALASGRGGLSHGVVVMGILFWVLDWGPSLLGGVVVAFSLLALPPFYFGNKGRSTESCFTKLPNCSKL